MWVFDKLIKELYAFSIHNLYHLYMHYTACISKRKWSGLSIDDGYILIVAKCTPAFYDCNEVTSIKR